MTSAAVMLDRFLRRDRAWDGRFLTGVVTTGIYCLPSCPARRPRPENVRFFADEAGARAAGLRPCRRCQPDRFYRQGDPELALVQGTLQRLRAAPGAVADVAALARLAGVGATRLHELCRLHCHDSAHGVLLRERVAAAAQQLLHTRRRVLDVALDAGFESSSAFHDNFKARTGMTPLDYRRLGGTDRFALSLPADFRVADTLAALARDPDAVDARRDGDGFHQAMVLAGTPAVLSIEVQAGRARCRVAARRALPAMAMAAAHRVALALLGLPDDPAPFQRRMARRRPWRGLVAARPGLRVLRTTSVFEAAAWAVIGQQVNLTFAFRCRRALLELCGCPVGDLRAHPEPAAVAALSPADLRARQFSRGKADYLIGLAEAVVAGELELTALGDGSAVHAERLLLGRRGIGPWSAAYVLMRGCGFQDCVPVGDAGLGAALQRAFGLERRPDAAQTRALLQPCAPHRSLASLHLWRSLGDPP